MSDMCCTYVGDRDDVLIAYLYNDIDRVERSAFESHLMACAVCQRELAELGGVRAQLARWSPPDLQSAGRSLQFADRGLLAAVASPQATVANPPATVASAAGAVAGQRRWWDEVPAWAQVAAALVCLGVGVGAANLSIRTTSMACRCGRVGCRRDRRSPRVRSGASRALARGSDEARTAAARGARRRRFVSVTPQVVADVSRPASEADLVRKVKALVEDNAKQQQSELALRVAQVSREVQAQRLADLDNIDRRLGLIQNNTGFQVAQQNEVINSLAVRVSQTR